MQKYNTIILDCYTDEPSGYGVRPYLGTHQIHLSQALFSKGIEHTYLTIDDLRYASGHYQDSTDSSVINRTINADSSIEIIHRAHTIYIVMGCFVPYEYFSCDPPQSLEVFEFLKSTNAKKILFYVMGVKGSVATNYNDSALSKIIDHVEHGNTYRLVLEGFNMPEKDLLNPNYGLLDKISESKAPIVDQILNPTIAEIETGTGCNTPFCDFCIESVRSPKVIYREPKGIIKQIKALYDGGLRHFRLGRQPNFYHYQRQNVDKLESLLSGIRESCPDIETLHIDNVNIVNVIGKRGKEFTRLVAEYCTSGNIAPFGIESFDNDVRKANGVVGSAEQVLEAIAIINEHGSEVGNDGFPKFLPGINLIYGLKGQSNKTHDINLEYLQKILDGGLKSRRLYYRNITDSTGVSFQSGIVQMEDNFKSCFDDIVDNYVIPMQKRVYPSGIILKGFREVKKVGDGCELRTLGTCSIKVKVDNTIVKPYTYNDVKIIKSLGYRLLKGELIHSGELPAIMESMADKK